MTEIVNPSNGGCWFCSTKENKIILFSTEFDSYVHEECLLKADKENPEREIMMREFNLQES